MTIKLEKIKKSFPVLSHVDNTGLLNSNCKIIKNISRGDTHCPHGIVKILFIKNSRCQRRVYIGGFIICVWKSKTL